ncbi:MAG: recombinase family protein, partial [Phototrophicaceae bacterium]
MTQRHEKHLLGRYQRWVEPDPVQWQVWQDAWDLLLEDKYTLKQICEILHQRGYKLKNGRPFIQVNEHGRAESASNTLSANFKNWFYAGWVVSRQAGIPPKQILGNWKPLVTTEKFERGLEIMERRRRKRTPRRKHFYLLQGLVYLKLDEYQYRMCGSTTYINYSAKNYSYYTLDGKSHYLRCGLIEKQVEQRLTDITLSTDCISIMRELFYSQSANRQQKAEQEIKRLNGILHNIDLEERNVMRLYMKKQLSETVWEGLWLEWQDRRNA